MVSFLTIEGGVGVTELCEPLERKLVVRALGLLEADHIRPCSLDELRHEVDAQAHRVDVPGRDLQIHARRQRRPNSGRGLTSPTRLDASDLFLPSPACGRVGRWF